jgi:hypothetical protein
MDRRLRPEIGRAGLSREFIAFVRGTRSSQEQNPGASRNRNGG